MAFARWDPIRDLLAIQQRLDRSAPGQAGWKPAVDLHETASDYVVTAELPGVSRDQIQIHFHDGRLTLSGERQGHVCARSRCGGYQKPRPLRVSQSGSLAERQF